MSVAARSRRRPADALDWWADGLVALARGPATRNIAWRTVLLRREGGLEVHVRRGVETRLIGTLSLDGSDPGDALVAQAIRRERQPPNTLVLRLPPADAVHKQLTFPAGVSDVLDRVLYNQIERIAPWPATQALFAYSPPVTTADGTMAVDVWVTSRERIEHLTKALAALGLVPGVVDIGSAADVAPTLNLISAEPARLAHRQRARRLILGTAMMAFVLAASVVGYGFVLDGHRRELRAALLAASRAAAAVSNSPDEQRKQDLAFEIRRARPSLSVLIEALSRALPDGASLERLEYRDGALTVSGHAQAAPALIAQLEASPMFTDVAFAAPTTRRDGENGVQFSISAKVAETSAAALRLGR